MAIKTTITIDKNGQLILPLEVNQYLNLQNSDWLKVKIESDGIVITSPKPLDEDTLEDLIHSGILIYSE